MVAQGTKNMCGKRDYSKQRKHTPRSEGMESLEKEKIKES